MPPPWLTTLFKIEQFDNTMGNSDYSGVAVRLTGKASLRGRLGFGFTNAEVLPVYPALASRRAVHADPAGTMNRRWPLSGLLPAKRGSAYLRLKNFRGSLDVVQFHYGPSVQLPPLPTPPRGDAVEVVVRREQPNSAGGTCTHAKASFDGATLVISSGIGGA